jgi:hypothetical protein
MATASLLSPLVPMPSASTRMPADTLLALHQRNAANYQHQVLAGVADSEAGLVKIELVLDGVPDALEAIRTNPLGRDGIEQLYALAEQFRVLAVKLKDAASHMARLRAYGVSQLTLFEARLAEVRVLSEDGVHGDDSTAYTGEDAQ